MIGLFKKRLDPSSQSLFDYVVRTFGVKAKDISLFQEAVRHKSVAKEHGLNDNERLEFLGDAVLDIIIAELLFEKFPQKTEGELTRIKARIVNRKYLGSLGLKLNMGEFVEFVDGKYVNKSTICGNAFEAFIGAIYVDQGFEKARAAVRLVMRKHADLDELAVTDTDYKSQILVWSQKSKEPIDFVIVNVEDLGHERIYHCEIQQEDRVLGKGQGSSKKKAEQEASRVALERI